MASSSLKYGKSSKCSSLNSPVLIKKYSRSQKLRAEALGWDGWTKESFETNQSLINNFQYISTEDGMKMDHGAASGLNTMAFENEKALKHSPLHSSVNAYETSFLSDDILMSVPNLSTSVIFDSSSPYLSTSKAIFTILLPSSQILVVNSAACQLINYSTDELCSMKLINIIQESHKHKFYVLQDFLKNSNQTPFNNGKLVELVCKDGETVPVSFYLKKIDYPEKCLAIAEPIDRKAALVSVDENGKILSYDEEIALIFKYDASELVGVKIQSLLPAINLSKNKENQWRPTVKQNITGRTKYGEAFPVCTTITSNPSSEVFKIMIWVYNALSGLIVLNKKLLITNFNNYFIKLLFGFPKKEIFNQPIINLIPTFCKDVGLAKTKKSGCLNGFSNFTNNTSTSNFQENESLEECSHGGSSENDEYLNCLKTSIASLSLNSYSESTKKVDVKSDIDSSLNTFFTPNAEENKEDRKNRGQTKLGSKAEEKSSSHVVDLVRDEKQQEKGFDTSAENAIVQEGKFLGFGKHSDGSYIDIKYQVRIAAWSDEVFYCIWLSRDTQRGSDVSKGLISNSAMTSSFNSFSFDGSLPKDSVCSEQCTRPSTASIISQCDENLTAGEYSQYYTNIRQIGKGAFGYVKMAFRNSDGLLVVTKFIKKQKINIRSWVFHSNLNLKIPLEISLLTTLQHPNIVKVLDVFHNDSFVQLVMEKHGAGFDLFEFIDRGPKCDEKLKSFIFRQIISAVHYLDSLGILHRDIKDENVIINEKFEVKLIDFGSAAFMPPNESFSKFYGTLEYCSPEVLQGNTYKGPELEIWALGVTLYVLTFGKNPFYKIEEIIKGYFSIPSPISEELSNLLNKMLDKNIETRITIDKVVEDPWINQPVSIENYRFEEVVRCYDEEAYPPKYVYEINSDEFYSRMDSQDDSDQMLDTNNSNSSLQNIPIDELGDFDENFQDVLKPPKVEVVGEKKNSLPALLSSTPVQKKNERLCKSSVGLRKHLENSLGLSDRSGGSRHSNSVGNENFIGGIRGHFKDNPKGQNSGEETNMPGSDDDVELQVRFKKSFDEISSNGKESSDSDDRFTLSQESFDLRDENDEQEPPIADERSSEEYFSPN